MAIYRKNPPRNDETAGAKAQNERSKGLGRGFQSLSTDNTPAEKKPLVVRRGVCPPEEKKPVQTQQARAPKKTTQPPGVGGRVVIRADQPPVEPLRSARSARKGTTVLIRTERDDPPKRYRVNERVILRDPHVFRPDRPIVINPRKKK